MFKNGVGFKWDLVFFLVFLLIVIKVILGMLCYCVFLVDLFKGKV